jgi:hypothetical protein
MTSVGQHENEARDLTITTYREAVVRRPHMYFGSGPRSDWPLVILAWTARDLTHLASASQHSVETTVFRDGQFEVHAREARISVHAELAP